MELTPFAVIDTDCIDRFKYNTIQYCPTSYNLLYDMPSVISDNKMFEG